MPLNKQTGEMYAWVTHTWNPISGACPHACAYCYVEDLKRNPMLASKYSGSPELVAKELTLSHGQDKTIFVSNCADLFAEAVSADIISAIMEHCCRYSGNTYLFQTKNPSRLIKTSMSWPTNAILCTTIETNRAYPDTKAPLVMQRVEAMRYIRDAIGMANNNWKLSVTIEPIMDFDLGPFYDMIASIKPDFVSIGADSKRCGLPEPSPDKVRALIKDLELITEVHQKKNLWRLLG